METYCVKEKKKTACVEPSGYKTAKNGRKMFWCTCGSCGIKKTRFVKGNLACPHKLGAILQLLEDMWEKLERKLQKWVDFLQVNGCANQEHRKC